MTWHGPGQVVCYPVVDLTQHKKDLRWYVRGLEEVRLRSSDVSSLHRCYWFALTRWLREVLLIKVAISYLGVVHVTSHLDDTTRHDVTCVRVLQVVIRVLARYGIEAARDPEHTGVW